MHHDHAFTGITARSPEKIVLMPADGRRQSVFWTEHVDGRGFSVILRENRGFWTDLRRQIVIDARDSGGHLLPSEMVGEKLRQWAELVRFDRRLTEMQRLHPSDVSLGRQDRNRERRNDDQAYDHPDGPYI